MITKNRKEHNLDLEKHATLYLKLLKMQTNPLTPRDMIGIGPAPHKTTWILSMLQLSLHTKSLHQPYTYLNFRYLVNTHYFFLKCMIGLTPV